MQIFVIEKNPEDIARSLCDKHVLSQIGETAELLALAHVIHKEGIPPLHRLKPRLRHAYHPCAQWVARSAGNYEWALRLGNALCAEYVYRYNHGPHAYQDELTRMTHPPFVMLQQGKALTPHAIVVPLNCLTKRNPIKSYRRYYHQKAQRMPMRWTRRLSPRWFTADEAPSFRLSHAAHP